MLLDKIEPSSLDTLIQRDVISPAILDEIAYIVLVGQLGVVPRVRKAGIFEAGQFLIRYEWHPPETNSPTPVLANEFISLTVVNAEIAAENVDRTIANLLALWKFVQDDQFDAIAYWPPEQRKIWIERTAASFGATQGFVRNLLSCYPLLRRLMS